MNQNWSSGRRKTGDGSYTLWSEQYGQSYHSLHGALTESTVVFLQNGLEHALFNLQAGDTLRVLEMGFGTGLNAFLTFHHPEAGRIEYVSLESAPLAPCTWEESPMADLSFNFESKSLWTTIQTCDWNVWEEVGEGKLLLKWLGRLQDFKWEAETFHVVYFDAFSPQVQPELWSAEQFARLANWMRPGGVLVTYCSQGQVQRNLKAAGWKVEKRPGPPGKREIIRAHIPWR
jgi:hypothetical protein